MYNHKEIEKKWQKFWADSKQYQAHDDSAKEKFYQLETFPYPSAAGLHVGHPKGYIAEDIHARFMRAQNREVLYTMGWDAFGLPTENFAVKVGKTPKVVAEENIANFKRQLQMFGLSYDWDREINTSSREYYKWTQWLFIQLYKKGLAYQAEANVNWCPTDQTVLAHEQVIDGKCDRCGDTVIQKQMKQWFFKITDFADRLINDLENLDWPESTKQQQKNWIGRSEGADVEFAVENNFLILPGWESNEQDNYYPWLSEKLKGLGNEVETFVYPKPEDHSEDEIIKTVLAKCKLNDKTVIIAHSLGCAITLKVLERLKKPVAKVVLTAGFLKPEFKDKKRPFETTFKWDFDFEKIKQNVKEIVILHDITDQVVPESAADELHEKLGGKLIKFAASEPHVKGQEEPEVFEAAKSNIKVFTTRPDTIFGATYIVLAPEHPLVETLKTPDQEKYVLSYVTKSKDKSELERTMQEKDKTGVFTGSYAINPATKARIPIWIADYVLASYGTGAIMAVPAHDQRDFDFAKKYELSIVKVVNDEGDQRLPNLRDGRLMNSGKYNTVSSVTARSEMAKEFGTSKVQYRLRDWSVSRQRYWGVPIPMINCEKCGLNPVAEKDLPVILPDDVDFRPKGMPPLASSESFMNVTCPNCSGPAKREPETLDTFVDSSWYYLRYTDPHNDAQIFAQDKADHWMPADLYIIGAEHSTMHLLYSRFINKFLFDQGLVKNNEPFLKVRHQGLIQGADGQKMSKSKGNVVNPDEVVEQFGADTIRIYEMFMGPFEDGQPWSTQGAIGSRRFIDKVWRYQEGGVFAEDDHTNHIHKLIKKITSDIQNLKFNTAIAAFMEFLNENKVMSKANWEIFLRLLAPFAPHITEELWQLLGHTDSIHTQAWSSFDEKFTQDEMVTVVVQISGRVRGSMELPTGSTQDMVKKNAMLDPKVAKFLEGKEIIKEIFVQDKLINFVLR